MHFSSGHTYDWIIQANLGEGVMMDLSSKNKSMLKFKVDAILKSLKESQKRIFSGKQQKLTK